MRICDDVVTYCDLESFIEIYIHYTMRLSTYNNFQFECVNINLPLNLPMSGQRPKTSVLDFRPSNTTKIQTIVVENAKKRIEKNRTGIEQESEK